MFIIDIDDVMIFTKDWETHSCDLKRELKTIERVGMKVKLRKCVFGRKRLKYLKHIIGEGVVTICVLKQVHAGYCSVRV